MYIVPNSTVRVLRGINIDNTYSNTLHFSTESEQYSFFSSNAKYVLNNYTYIRKENVLRVEILADKLYDCNYIMFQNTAYGDKWFYGFITNVEYVNNETSNITYELDVMQTWYFEYHLRHCFVEREHAESDEVGENLVPDNLELGEYISDDFDATNQLGQLSIVIAATFDSNYDDVSGGTYSRIYSGLYYNVFADYQSANNFINGAVEQNKMTGIVSIFMMPTNMISSLGEPAKVIEITKNKKVTGSIDGYTPRNNKLYTHPYNFLYVTNLNGIGTEFPYEFFDSDSCGFVLSGDMSCNPQVVLAPKNYKGVVTNYNEKMILDGFPQCSYNTDSFKAWLAQSGASTFLTTGAQVAGLIGTAQTVGTGAAMIGTGAFAAPVALVAGGLMVGNALVEVVRHATLPPQAHNTGGSSAMTALGLKEFAFMHMHIRKEFCEIIDKYWDMYGYPCHKVKIPKVSTRPHWNYIKTLGCNAVGNIPSDDLAKIKSIFDNGVTFWKNNSEVGNYSLDNRLKGGD